MSKNYTTAPAENGSGVTDLFEQTWDRYLHALDEWRDELAARRARGNNILVEISNAARDPSGTRAVPKA